MASKEILYGIYAFVGLIILGAGIYMYTQYQKIKKSDSAKKMTAE